MSTHQTPSPEMAADTPFDSALRQHLHTQAEPEDDGFSLRVMAALPPRAVQRRIRWVEWVEYAQWTAISVAAVGVATLMPTGDAGVAITHSVAAYALIGLLIFWAVPSRWSRG